MPRFLDVLSLVLLGAFTAVACTAPAPTPTPIKAPATPTPSQAKPLAVAGKAIYQVNWNCASCHGSSGKGDGSPSLKPANFTDLAFMRRATPARFFDSITRGKGAMPAWVTRLSEEERWNVLFYEWSFSTSPEKVAAGKRVYEANCATCHGVSGKGDGPAGAVLTTKPAKFTDLEQTDISNQDLFDTITNGEPPMPSWKQLSEEDRWNVVDYLRTFSATLFP